MFIYFIGSLPESLTQGLLVGKLLVGGPGVPSLQRQMDLEPIIYWSSTSLWMAGLE